MYLEKAEEEDILLTYPHLHIIFSLLGLNPRVTKVVRGSTDVVGTEVMVELERGHCLNGWWDIRLSRLGIRSRFCEVGTILCSSSAGIRQPCQGTTSLGTWVGISVNYDAAEIGAPGLWQPGPDHSPHGPRPSFPYPSAYSPDLEAGGWQPSTQCYLADNNRDTALLATAIERCIALE
ncbi:uncharacterized protein BDZ83DRAFT_728396 [Colletotrichum acutatum]|uniref:Uncharacterized protein n=1 Tax=Glomerella acutata TaxID=27357 RepID=A0AAD8USG7_GLOAC|nr:uncharacterized protein BDZ83DRAFT_728396 [Colletotrichum acutatum]KAK1727987.1 hypothetical protein BDZ83DRAFT_728396 [Colletotrichum acutatum]